MCKFLLATFPAGTDVAALANAIPPGLKRSVLRRGLRDSWPEPKHFGFDNVDSHLQLPYSDEHLVRCTRIHCDCWSSLASDQPDRKELSRWRSIFDAIHLVIPRFGFIVHFGDPNDVFDVAGPIALPLSDSVPLHRIKMETFYDVTP